jgi:hypothetical protein
MSDGVTACFALASAGGVDGSFFSDSSWGCSSQIDPTGRVIFTADTYSRDGRRFTVLSDQKLSAFLELESAIRGRGFFS